MKVLALTKYGSLAASTRQRFIQYAPALERAGIALECSPLLDNDYLADLLAGRRPSRSSIARAYLRRLKAIGNAGSADVIWLHCEFLPYWPGLAESLAARLVGRPIVFDFDDAIFHNYDENARWPARLLLEGKLEPLLRRVSACACGNAYLRDYAARFCPHSIILPTVVDTAEYRPKPHGAKQLTIGWIGSPSTWRGVRPILPVLRKICEDYGARFLAVGAGLEGSPDLFPGMELRDWSEATEIADVQAMDIGIMPLLDQPFERGKSGYKLIQYMACEVPVVASAVGVNCRIVDQGVNGFLANSTDEWGEALQRLIADPAMRRRLGKAGRQSAVEHYSLASQAPRLVELLQSAGKRPVEGAASHG